MDLITPNDIEEALGRSLEGDEVDEAPFYITKASHYITTYTGTSFEEKTETLRFKADYYGRVELPEPTSDVVEVKHYLGSSAGNWQWDGLNEVYGLQPRVTVDIEFTYGYAAVPEDVQTVALELVIATLDSPDGRVQAPLAKYRVGDVEEGYRATFSVSTPRPLGADIFNDLQRLILNQYRTTADTWHVGFHQHNTLDNSGIPDNDDALFE